MPKKSKFVEKLKHSSNKITIPRTVLEKNFKQGETTCRICGKVIIEDINETSYSIFDRGQQLLTPIFAHRMCAMTHDALGIMNALSESASKQLTGVTKSQFIEGIVTAMRKGVE